MGRAEQLAQLEAALADAAAGTARVLALAGEAGIGKSRLAAEWAARARAGGAASAVAVCVDLRDGQLPYGPIAHLLRGLAPQLGADVMRELTAHAPAELVPLLPAAYRRADRAEGPAEQGRLFERLAELLDAASAVRPLALCVDDLHWADGGTLDFVRYLARSLGTERIAVVLTYRPEHLCLDAELEATVLDLHRSADGLLTLPPFTVAQVHRRLAELHGADPADGLAERLHEQTGGNPYFIEELAAAGTAGTGATPPTLRGLLTERLRTVGADTLLLLRLMAVAGRPCRSTELAAAELLPASRLDAALGEALARQVIVRTDEAWSTVAFRHPLVREATAAEIGPDQRRRLHAGWAGALERCGEPDAAARARHWDAAGAAGPALSAQVAAAEEAAVMAGFAQAWQHWRRSLDLWPQVPDAAARTGLDEAGLLERAAGSARWAGQPEQAVTLLHRAADLPEVRAEPLRLACLLELLSRCEREAGRGERARAAAERAGALLVGQPPSAVAARVAAAGAASALIRSHYREAVVFARQAVALADASGAVAEAGHAYNTLGVSLAMTGDTDAGLAALDRARAIADGQGLVEDRLRAANNLSFAQLNSGRYRESLATALQGFQLAHRHGRAATAGAMLLTNAATSLVWLGEWAEADTLAQQGLVSAGPDGFSAALHLNRAEVAVATGRFDDAEGHLAAASGLAVSLDEPQLLGHVAACRTELLLWRGEVGPALAVVEDGLAAARTGEDVQLELRLCALGLRAVADQAELDSLRRRGGPGDRLDRLREAAARLVAELPGARSFPEARADAVTAAAEAGRADAAAAGHPADPAGWLCAAQGWAELQRPYPQAYCLWRAGEVLLAVREPRRAQQALRDACGIAGRLGAGPLAAEIAAVSRRARLDLAPPARLTTGAALGGTTATEAEPAPAGLTAREREVLTLLHDGLTNRQISRALFISEKTASVHVSRIMAKLDVGSRGAAAAAARRLQLVATGQPT